MKCKNLVCTLSVCSFVFFLLWLFSLFTCSRDCHITHTLRFVVYIFGILQICNVCCKFSGFFVQFNFFIFSLALQFLIGSSSSCSIQFHSCVCFHLYFSSCTPRSLVFITIYISRKIHLICPNLHLKNAKMKKNRKN